MVTRTGDREIGAVSGRLPDNPGELACMGWWPDLGWQIINLIWCKGLLTFFGFTNLHFSPFIESSDEEDNVENIHKRGEDFSVLLEKSGKDAVVLVHSIPSSLYRWNKVKSVGLYYKW